MDELTYQEEPWSKVGAEVGKLAAGQFPECDITFGAFPFDLNFDGLNKMDEDGLVHVTTARNPDIIGYIVNLMVPRHMLFKACYAAQIGWYVSPEYRKGGLGSNLLKKSEELLKARGVAFLSASHTINLNAAPLFERLGWKQTEMNYTKVI